MMIWQRQRKHEQFKLYCVCQHLCLSLYPVLALRFEELYSTDFVTISVLS